MLKNLFSPTLAVFVLTIAFATPRPSPADVLQLAWGWDELATRPLDDLRLGCTIFPELPHWEVGKIDKFNSVRWYNFRAQAGQKYVIETAVGSLRDTTLTLYGMDAKTQLAFDDDSGEGLASRILWTAPTDGVYYVCVAPYHPAQTGIYALSLEPYSPVTIPATSVGLVEVSSVDTVVGHEWHAFRVMAGERYVIETDLGTLPDSTLTLYGKDATSVLSFDDDGGDGRASRIEWTAPTSGVYFAKVAAYAPGQAGTYALSVTDASRKETITISCKKQKDGSYICTIISI